MTPAKPEFQHVASGARDAQAAAIRLAFLTNVVAPYWKSIFDSLSSHFRNMRIFLSARMEGNRPWDVDWGGLDVVLQKTITMKRRWRHPGGFSESLYTHLPLDTVLQLRKYRPDVVISNEMGFRTLMALIYRKIYSSTRLIVWADVAESTERGRGRMRTVLRRVFQKNVDGFVVLGESGARYIRSLGAADQKIFRVPYSTDLTRFAVHSLLRTEAQARRLLYVGQLIERKGLSPFLEVLSKWASDHPDRPVEFVLAGDGPLRNRLESAPIPPNLKLTFLGNLSWADLPHVYAFAGIFAFPTLADTWGVVVNEALASGLPVLGSNYSQAVEELVEDGRNGWVFTPDKTEQMYQAIDRSMNTPLEVLHKMRECARTTASQLTPDCVARRIGGIVKSIARVS